VDRNFSQQISAINEGDGAAGGRDEKHAKNKQKQSGNSFYDCLFPLGITEGTCLDGEEEPQYQAPLTKTRVGQAAPKPLQNGNSCRACSIKTESITNEQSKIGHKRAAVLPIRQIVVVER
jgi:hypothetical protein